MTHRRQSLTLKESPDLNTIIYVRLLDEGTDVWRPVDAIELSQDRYRLIGERDADERWEFESGSTVRVEKRNFESKPALVAVEVAD